MTKQTKHFIDLSDLLGFRFQCHNEGCGAVLAIPLGTNVIQSQVLKACPQCKASWAQLNGSSYEALFKKFGDVVAELKSAPFGFKLALEIKDELDGQKAS